MERIEDAISRVIWSVFLAFPLGCGTFAERVPAAVSRGACSWGFRGEAARASSATAA